MSLENKFRRAVRDFEARRFAKARATARQLLVANPNQLHFVHLLGFVELEIGNYEAARDALTRARVGFPSDTNVVNALAIVHDRLGDRDKAEACFNEAMALAPSRADILVNFGNFLGRGRDYERSVGAYEVALKLDSDNHEVRSSLAEDLLSLGRRE